MVKTKIEKAKRRMKRLNSTHYKVVESLRYCHDQLKNCKDLDHRDICPHCHQKIKDYSFYTKQIQEFEKKIKLLEAWIDQNCNYSKIVDINKPIRELREIKRKEYQTKIEEYLKENRNKLNKTIRSFELPKINNDDEKELWNRAMELQLNNRRMEDNSDFFFDI